MFKRLLILINLINTCFAIEGFDQLPSKYFGEYPAKYACYTSGSFENGSLQKCDLPTPEETIAIRESFLKTVEIRQAELLKVIEKKDNYRNSLLEIIQNTNEGYFTSKYLELIEHLEEDSESNLRYFFNQKERSYSVKGISDVIQGIGESSIYIEELNKIIEIVSSDLSRKQMEKAYYELINDWQKPLRLISVQLRATKNYIAEAMKENLMSNSITFEKGLTYSKRCKNMEQYRGWEEIVFRTKEFSWDRGGFDVIENSETIRKILQGGRNGNPLHIECKKVNKYENISLRYDNVNHILTIPYFITRKMNWPLTSGNIGFEFHRKTNNAGPDMIRNFLKEELK